MSMYEDMYKPELVKVVDPIVDLKQKITYPIVRGGQETTERVFSTTNYSESYLQFTVPPPSPNTFVSRRVRINLPVQLTFTEGTDSNGNYANKSAINIGNDSFKQFPLSTLIQTLNVTINGQSVSLEMNDVIKPLLLYHNNSRMLPQREFSLSPCTRDTCQAYSMGLNASGESTLQNVLGSTLDNNIGTPPNRGGFTIENYTHTTDANAKTNTDTIQAILCEEIMLSPLLFGGVEDNGFIGIQKFEVSINWLSDKTRVWAHDPSKEAGPFNFTVSVAPQFQQPQILFRYITPPAGFIQRPFYQYSYNEINRYTTLVSNEIPSYDDGVSAGATWGSINGLSTFQIIGDNLQLNSIPRFIYVFVRKRTPSYLDAESYLSITNVRVNWNNSNSLLGDASQQQLYEMCRKNGVDLSWADWSAKPSPIDFPASGVSSNVTWSGIGSVLCIEMGTDIGLRPGEAPGLIGTYNLQIQLQVKNYSGSPLDDAEMVLLTITPGIFTIYQNSATKRIGIVEPGQIMNASPKAGYDYYTMKKNLMSGGRPFKKSMKKFFQKIKPALKKYGKKGTQAALNYAKSHKGDILKLAKSKLPSAAQELAMMVGLGASVGGARRRKRRSTKRRAKSTRRGGKKKRRK